MLECMKRLVLWYNRHRTTITLGNSWISKRKFSEGPVTVNICKWRRLDKGEYCRIQRLPTSLRWMKRGWRAGNDRGDKHLFWLSCFIWLLFFVCFGIFFICLINILLWFLLFNFYFYYFFWFWICLFNEYTCLCLVFFVFVFLFFLSFPLGGCYKDEGCMRRDWKMSEIGVHGVKFSKNQYRLCLKKSKQSKIRD